MESLQYKHYVSDIIVFNTASFLRNVTKQSIDKLNLFLNLILSLNMVIIFGHQSLVQAVCLGDLYWELCGLISCSSYVKYRLASK